MNNTQNGIFLSLQSALRIFNSTVSGNSGNGIALFDDSSVALYSGSTPLASITGNASWGVICGGGSRLIGVADGVTGNTAGQVNCPPINIP